MRIATYNIYLGGTGRFDAIHSVLSHLNADVIALTEADDPQLVGSLAERLEMHHVWVEGSGNRHIATLSRFPILEWHIYNTPPLTQAVLETKLHLGEKQLTVYNAHFLPYLLLPFEIRRWQAVGKLLKIIQARQPGPHLILGDLNAIASGDRVLQHRNPAKMRRIMMLQLGIIFRFAIPRLLNAGYTDCYRHLHPNDEGFTWYPTNPTTRYDYILADSKLTARLQSCEVVDNIDALEQASDHMPLVADFEI